ncbi:hypothetical protein BS78_02G399400 [Paspalum vaginatum]|nr:hypothetical protein BS78_02G399400 [Paspalum vaginatum]
MEKLGGGSDGGGSGGWRTRRQRIATWRLWRSLLLLGRHHPRVAGARRRSSSPGRRQARSLSSSRPSRILTVTPGEADELGRRRRNEEEATCLGWPPSSLMEEGPNAQAAAPAVPPTGRPGHSLVWQILPAAWPLPLSVPCLPLPVLCLHHQLQCRFLL